MPLIDQILALQGIGQEDPERRRAGRIGTPARTGGPARSNIFINALLGAGRAESSQNRIARQLGIIGVDQARSALPAIDDPTAKARIASDLLSGRSLNVGQASQAPGVLNAIIQAGLQQAGTRATGAEARKTEELKTKGLLDLAGLENEGKALSSLLGNEFALLRLLKDNPEALQQITSLLGVGGLEQTTEGKEGKRTKEQAQSKLEQAMRLLGLK